MLQRGRDGRLPVRRSEGLLAVHTDAQRGEPMIEERLVDPHVCVNRAMTPSSLVPRKSC